MTQTLSVKLENKDILELVTSYCVETLGATGKVVMMYVIGDGINAAPATITVVFEKVTNNG